MRPAHNKEMYTSSYGFLEYLTYTKKESSVEGTQKRIETFAHEIKSLPEPRYIAEENFFHYQHFHKYQLTFPED